MSKRLKPGSGPPALYRWLFVGVLVLALGLAVSACGGSSSSNSSTSEAASTTGGEGTTGGEAESNAATVAAAKEVIAPYIGQPSPFSVSEALKEIPKGATIAYAEPGTGIGAILWEGVEAAAKTMGVKAVQVKAGPSAQSVRTGMESIISMHPDAVIAAGQALDLWKPQAEQMIEEGIYIVTDGVAEPLPGIEAQFSGTSSNARTGKLLANYVPAEMNPEANIAIYQVPELSFSTELTKVIIEELKTVCPKCATHTVNIGIETLGTTSPSTVVSDLQSHSETNVALFTVPEIFNGVPAALKAAGIEVETLTYAAAPTELQYMKEGTLDATLAFDLVNSSWEFVDIAARGIIGQEPSGPEGEGLSVVQFLTKEDITFDPAKGWVGYPDFVERWEKIWGLK